MSDRLATELQRPGYDPDTVELVCERAAILQHDAGLDRWRAGIEAQRQHLAHVQVYSHDI